LNVPEVPSTPEQLVLDVAASASAAGAFAAAATADTSAASAGKPASQGRRSEFAAIQNQEDAPPCTTCGSIMVRSGACYKCANCGTTSGCA
jgi:ribonucleoside-diphosphate reductase alpha chain